jgi:Flp pilus assembly pilin Flp
MGQVIRRFLGDDSAQDLVEYGYLAALVGLTGIVVWSAIVGLIGDRYEDYNNQVHDVWEPLPPP